MENRIRPRKKQNEASLMNILWFFVLIGWGGLTANFFVTKNLFQPKNLWIIPTLYGLFAVPIVAIIDLNIALLTLIVASGAYVKWSTTNLKSE